MITDPRTALIQKIPLFSSLSQDALSSLAARLVERPYPEGTVLFQEGDFGDRFYIIEDGQVAIIKAMGSADERLIGLRGSGEFIGEMSLLNRDMARTASARVQETARLLEMSRADFDALLEQQPSIAYQMLQVLSDRLSAAHNESIRDLKEKNRQLRKAYAELKAAQEQIIEKKVLEHELEQAREIQQSLLPGVIPSLPGFDIGAAMVPARTVGGDLYDVIPLDSDRLVLLIGDVSGKAMPAALFMAQTASLLRAETSHDPAPDRVLHRVNQHLMAANSQGMFVTLVYGVLNRSSREFRYIRAGHEFPLYRSPAGEISHLSDGGGQLIGLFSQPVLFTQVITLPIGSTLLLYTDGVNEARDKNGDYFNLEDPENCTLLGSAGSAQSLCDALARRVLDHQGDAQQSDDITLLALRSLEGNDPPGGLA
jgi:sigma-B regulation protein RsbU (phosphoserine phosphatase)